MSWAAVAGGDAPKAVPAISTVPEGTVLVVDANAIIAGVSLDRLAQTPITVPEVLREVRDSASRHRLATLPFGIETREPSEESMKAVTRFARGTGDLAALSRVDLRLIALAHTLHVSVHGEAGLRSSPAPPVVLSRKPRTGAQLPGWGDTGDTWEVLDNLPDSEAPADSRIVSAVQQLDLSGRGGADSDSDDGDRSTEAGSAAHAGGGDDEEGDGGWEVAAKSHNAARRRRRKAVKRANWEAAVAAAEAADAAAGADDAAPAEPAQAPAPATPPPGAAPANGAAVANGAASAAVGVEARVGGAGAADGAASGCGGGSGSGSGSEAGEGGEDRDSEGEDEGPVAYTEEAGGEGGAQGGGADAPRVSIITADFAMQNVILQMGLRLLAPNGLRVTQLSKWVLRCAACAAVSKEVGRIFCPRCGNSTMERVHVVIGPDGAETYGVRKHHVLKGTRFPLPKPRGGRSSKNPVLSEDVLMATTQRLQRRMKKQEEVDPFAPEYGADSWFRANATNTVPAAQQQALAQAAGMSALLANSRRNPNDRHGAHRTNRRK